MPKHLKKHGFSLRLERHFTSETADAFDLIHFRDSDESGSALEAPDNWSAEAVAMLAEEAGAPSIPAQTRSREENTVPSWLWRRTAEGRARCSENSTRQIFHRVAGAAAYAGWKKGVFADEAEARVFFDEVRYLLAQRMIAIEPRQLATAGLDWAYGIDGKPNAAAVKAKTGTSIRNSSIDALLSGDTAAQQKWQNLLESGAKTGFLKLTFADIAADWNGTSCDQTLARAAIDILAFRREDGAIAIDRIGHAVRLLTVLLELKGNSCIAIGLNNLAPMLMSQALAYDSEAGRTTAAALTATVTAEACATSAQLAGLLGPSLDFAANRESVLRALRNHRRAAYGDHNDYEKISVLPAPLELGPGVDLALIAAARRRWDEALELAQQHGLRFAYFTDFTPVTSLVFFLESVTQGVEPIAQLTIAASTEGEIYRRDLYPAVNEALIKLGYNSEARKEIVAYIAGTGTLKNAPGIDHAALQRLGFDEETLEKVEHYLSHVTNIRHAFTPWILGDAFMRETLKIPAGDAENPTFDLLKHLGFSSIDIDAANFYCYGAGTARGAKGLSADHAPIFATAEEIIANANIRMAASVQSFLSGDTGLRLAMPEDGSTVESERLVLDTWRQGIKSVSVEWDVPTQPADMEAQEAAVLFERLPAASKDQPKQQYTAPLRSTLRSRSKASNELIGLKGRDGKAGTGKKSKPDGNRR